MPTTGIKSAGYPRYGTAVGMIQAPANLIKTFSLAAPVGFSTADGYPNGTLAVSVGSQGGAPDAYYDKLVMKWHGQGQISAVGASAIIYSSSNMTVAGISNSCVNSNFSTSNSNSAVDARLTFKHGTLITGISGGNGSPVVLSTINQSANFSVGTKIKIQVGVSSNLLNGPNSDGSWTISATGSNSTTLLNSTGVISPTGTFTGGPDVQSEAICSMPGIAWSFSSGQTFTNFSNLVFCKIANEAAVDAGKLVDPDYVAQLKTLGVKWLRTMDTSGLQGSWESDIAARVLPSFISWPANYRNANYDVGTITNNGVVSGADDYTCSAPTITSTGAYKQGELVIGTMSASNSATAATLNINGRGKKRIIITGVSPWSIPITAPAASAGQTLTFTWTISGVTLSPVVYTTTTTGPHGDDTSSAGTLSANLVDFLQVAAATSGKVFYGNSGGVAAIPLTPQSGATNLTYSGPAYCSIVQIPILDGNSSPSLQGTRTFSYCYIMDAFLCRGGGLVQTIPLEYYTELCNSVGASVWYNWPIQTTLNWITGVTTFFRNNLTPGLRLMTEYGNEMWNFGLAPWGLAQQFGHSLGVGMSQNGTENQASYSYSAARTQQFGAAAITAWTATRPRKDLYVGTMSAQWDMNNWDINFLQGSSTGNSTFLTYGGPDGAAGSTNPATNYSVAPNRVCDSMDAGGFAPYWGSSFLGGDTGGVGFFTNTLTGTVIQNAPLLVAADKYRDGNLTGGSGAYDDLYNQFYSAVSLGGPADGINLLQTYKLQNSPQLEGILRKYDSNRISSQGRPISVLHYEAGPQFGVGNINNGTNNATVDIAAVSNQLAFQIVNSSWNISTYTTFGTIAISSGTYDTSTGLITLTLASPATVPVAAPIRGLTGTGTNLADLNGGWNVNVATSSSTTLVLKGPVSKGAITIASGTLYLNAMDLATNICGMVYNFKFSTQYYQLYKNYYTDVITVHSGREACASQYGYAGGQWAMIPGSYTLGLAAGYSSCQATTDFNAGA